MFDAFRKFLSDCTAGDKHPSRFADDDYRLAASALLVHAAAIDGEITPVGRDKLHAVIKRRFELDEEATNELVAEATAAEQEWSISIISPASSTAPSMRPAAAGWSR